MQKKKIIILSILLLIIVAILALVLPKNNKINLMQENKIAEYKYSSKIGETEYDITDVVQEPSEVVPTISAGMIPIKKNGESWVIADKNDWYDYSKGQPAYIMLSDGYYKSELERGIKEEQLANNSVGVGVLDDPNIIGTIYMYIPRFAVNDQGEILYIKQECSVAGTWEIPEIFMYETKNVDLSLSRTLDRIQSISK